VRRIISSSVAVMAVFSGLIFGGAGVAAATPTPTATPVHTQRDEIGGSPFEGFDVYGGIGRSDVYASVDVSRSDIGLNDPLGAD
jgi:hypothetical protein